MSHTPGPWRTASYDQGLTWKVETAEGRRAVASYIAGLSGECECNAALIAAAPELLSSLRAMTEALNMSRLVMREQETRDLAAALCADALAVIAKAEGR